MASFFEQELRSQPQVVRGLLEYAEGTLGRLVRWLERRPVGFVMIAARGTSDNAATFAKYAFGALNRMPVALAPFSLFTRYDAPPDVSGGLVVGISQSGRGEDVCQVIESATHQGAATLAITNDPQSPLAEAADEVLPLLAGEERSVAASKTYTASLAALAALAAHWSGSARAVSELQELPGWMERALESEDDLEGVLEQMKDGERAMIVGRGFNYATVHEISLKIKELAYIQAEGYSAADLRHGPIALLERDFPVLAIAPDGPSFADMAQVCDQIAATGAALSVATNNAELARKGYPVIRLPDNMPEWLSPIVAVLPGQLLALRLAQLRGLDPDQPRRLTKITITR